MKLGFVSAIFPDQTLDQVLKVAAQTGLRTVEVMCWPPGKALRRYAGVTHIDASDVARNPSTVARIKDSLAASGIEISALGYYPNALSPDPAEAKIAIDHLGQILLAASALGVPTVTTFVGRDPARSVNANWPRFLEVWRPLVAQAEALGVKIAIENCPMLFTDDEWPGGKNLAHTPEIWRRMFNDIPSPAFGLNYDPSHLVWQQIDHLRPLYEFKNRLFHVHAKDARVNRDRLNEVGVLATPLCYHTPRLPGLGDVNWGGFFATLGEVGYTGPVCIEVEDRAYEHSQEGREAALMQSARFLRQFMP